jgi:hypothetical protein
MRDNYQGSYATSGSISQQTTEEPTGAEIIRGSENRNFYHTPPPADQGSASPIQFRDASLVLAL